MSQPFTHRPVLLDEVVAALAVSPDGYYVDGTFGRGGHAAAVLAALGPAGRLLAMDRDAAAVRAADERFGGDARFEMVQGNYTMLSEVLMERGMQGRVDGLLLDLGVSSPQLDDPGRGFSFQSDGPLDMRMDTTAGETAAHWLARADERTICDVIRRYGEERHARRIARAIVTTRDERPLRTTRQLSALVATAVPQHDRHKHPATRTFQAIRIHINHELEDLKSVLAQVPGLLAPAGRLAVIAFHSLEDRIVKRFIRDEYRGLEPPQEFPLAGMDHQPRLRPVGKAIRPGAAEVAANPRARSAVLRVAERLQ